jgi:transposase-like protein
VRVSHVTGHLEEEVAMSVMQQQRQVRTRRSFTDEFKRGAVALVRGSGYLR